MAKIVVVVRDFGADKKAVVQALRTAAGTGVGDILRAVASGAPVFEKTMFDRDDPDVPIQLVALAELLIQEHVDFSMYELLDNQIFSRSVTYYEPSVDALRNIIQQRSRSLEEQRNVGRLQDGVQ